MNALVDEYYSKYDILLEGRDPEEFKKHVAVQAQIEIGFERFLEEKNYQAIVTHFGDLGALQQLPGLAIQRLMEKGYSQQDGDWDFGFDPFGFGFGFGGYQQQSGPGFSSADTPELQAARNFIVNRRYAEARRVLDGIANRTARWYYLSSLSNQGLGNSIDALQDARRAAQMEPGNTEYQVHLRNLQSSGRTYRTQTTYAQPGGLMRWCWSMILLNLLCNCCCGGGWGWGWRFRGI